MSKKETDDERIKRLCAESVAHQLRRKEAGEPGADMTWAIAAAVLDTLNAGYRITDLDCFQLSPLYTGPLKSPARYFRETKNTSAQPKPPVATSRPPDIVSEALKKMAVAHPADSDAIN